MYNNRTIISLLIVLFNIILLMTSVGYFGAVAKNKTKNIKSQTYKIVLFIFTFELVDNLLNLSNSYDKKWILLLGIAKISVTLIVVFIYGIYIRVGQYLCDKNSLQGSIILNNKNFIKNINMKYIFFPIVFLVIWNIIFYHLFNIVGENYNNQYGYNDIAVLIKICIIAPITEEIIYRHLFMSIIADILGNNNFVLKINILISALIFSCSHVGILGSDLLKFFQILPLSLILSYLNIKKGLEYSISIHMLFNISTFFILI